MWCNLVEAWCNNNINNKSSVHQRDSFCFCDFSESSFRFLATPPVLFATSSGYLIYLFRALTPLASPRPSLTVKSTQISKIPRASSLFFIVQPVVWSACTRSLPIATQNTTSSSYWWPPTVTYRPSSSSLPPLLVMICRLRHRRYQQHLEWWKMGSIFECFLFAVVFLSCS